jgi:hypothetical protein
MWFPAIQVCFLPPVPGLNYRHKDFHSFGDFSDTAGLLFTFILFCQCAGRFLTGEEVSQKNFQHEF